MVRGHGPADPMFTAADVAAELAVQRRSDEALVRQVTAFTAGVGPQPSGQRPVFMLIRAIHSLDFELLRFLDLCAAVDAEPVLVTMLRDRFTSINHDKYRRARMTFWWQERTRVLRAASLSGADGRAIGDLTTRKGECLSDYHHRLVRSAAPNIRMVDLTQWLRPGQRTDYLHFFALAIVGAVLVEAVDDDPAEQEFLHERMLPGWSRACEEFGTRPLMTSHYAPDEISDDLWWGYPGHLFSRAATLLYAPEATARG